MKSWILGLALLVAFPAAAETIATIENKAGGTINLTSDKCSGGMGYFVYSRAGNGQVTITGCFLVDGEFVVVKWSDGTVYSYPGFMVTATNPQPVSRRGEFAR